MTQRKSHPSRRRGSKVSKPDRKSDLPTQILKYLLLAKAIWEFVKELIGDDPEIPYRRRDVVQS